MTKHSPNISTYFIENEMSGVTLNLNERNFRIAFTVEPYLGTKKQTSDPRYVKYLFRLYGNHKGKEF